MNKSGADDFIKIYGVEKFAELPEIDIDEIDDGIEDEYNLWKERREPDQSTPKLIGFRLDDIGNGDRFVSQHGDGVKWSSELGWKYFDDKRWRDNSNREIERRAERTARTIFIEAARAKDNDHAVKVGKWAATSSSMGKVNAMLESAKNKPGMAITHESFDQNQWLLNLNNGTYNLTTGEFREHRKFDFITKCSMVDFDPAASCPLWDAFIDRVMPNKQTTRFLQKCTGYSLTGSINEQCFFLLYGTGKNGKSTFLETVAALMSDYADVMRTETLMVKKFDSAPYETAVLRGLRFVYAVEPNAGSTLNTSFIKQQTGGEKLQGRFLYQDFFSFRPTHKLWIGANHDIKIPETDEGIRRRVKEIPFKIKIPEAERDLHLTEKLAAELPGILNWAITGLKIYLTEGLGSAPEVDEATSSYFDRVNPLKDFLDEACLLGPEHRVKRSDLHKQYLEWAREFGERLPFKRRRFNERMKENGFETKTLDGYDFWYGVALK